MFVTSQQEEKAEENMITADQDHLLYDLEAGSLFNNEDFVPQEPITSVPSSSSNRRTSQVSGAAVVGGLAGLVLVGPVVGLIAASSAAVVATREGKAGDAARKTGDKVGNVARKTQEITANAGKHVQSLDHKGILEKTSNKFMNSYNWISKKVPLSKATNQASSQMQILP